MSDNNLPNEGMENENEELENSMENNADTADTADETGTYENSNNDISDDATDVNDNAANGDTVDEYDENQPVFGDEAVSVAQFGSEAVENDNNQAAAPRNKFKASAIVAWILVVVLLAVDVVYYMTNIFNKYNHIGYLNVSGYTIGEVVAGMGMSFDDFKEMYGLPSDMRKDTYMESAQSIIPLSTMAEMNGMDIEALKEAYGFGDEINENSTWGEAIDSMTLRDYVGETQFEEFKTRYNLGDEITLDTLWGDIRQEVEKMQLAERLAEEAAADASASPSASPSASAETSESPSPEPTEATDAAAEATDAAEEVSESPATDAE